MSVVVAGLTLRNPVMLAAGCAARELHPHTPLDSVGALVTRSITLTARPGAPMPRILEAPAGLLHSVGHPNPGLDAFLAVELPELVRLGARVVVSVAGAQLGDLAELARRLGQLPGVAALEVDLATPDAAAHGLFEAREPFQVAGAVGAVARELPPGVPLLAKLRPDAARVVESARTAAEAGAQAVVVGGAVPAALPDGRPAGLSGPAIAAISRRCVALVREALPGLDVVAGGGVATAADAQALLDLGAVAVQVGSAVLHDPLAPTRILEGLGMPPGPPAPPATRGAP